MSQEQDVPTTVTRRSQRKTHDRAFMTKHFEPIGSDTPKRGRGVLLWISYLVLLPLIPILTVGFPGSSQIHDPLTILLVGILTAHVLLIGLYQLLYNDLKKIPVEPFKKENKRKIIQLTAAITIPITLIHVVYRLIEGGFPTAHYSHVAFIQGFNPIAIVLLFLILVLFSPLVNELFFRKVYFRSITQGPIDAPIKYAVLTAAISAILSIVIHYFFLNLLAIELRIPIPLSPVTVLLPVFTHIGVTYAYLRTHRLATPVLIRSLIGLLTFSALFLP